MKKFAFAIAFILSACTQQEMAAFNARLDKAGEYYNTPEYKAKQAALSAARAGKDPEEAEQDALIFYQLQERAKSNQPDPTLEADFQAYQTRKQLREIQEELAEVRKCQKYGC